MASASDDPQNPEKRIVIRLGDLDQEPTIPESDWLAINNTHPFDSPELRAHLDTAFPDYTELADTANRPGVSEQPDELERWEAGRILTRKARFDHEPDDMYLRRLLYEETFSVNQSPGSAQSFRGSYGMTPGGLISHCYQEGGYSGLTVAELATWPVLEEDSFVDAMRQLGPDWQSGARDLLTFVYRLTSPHDYGMPGPDLVQRYANGEIAQARVEYETIGYRLLKMLHVTPEMLEPVADKELQAKFVNHASAMPKAELIIRAWHRSQALLPEGYYTSAETPEIMQIVENLLALRTHSEMQIFYKYLSPSGYTN